MVNMRSRLTSVAIAVLAALAGACTPSPASPSNSAPFSQRDLLVGTGPDAAAGKQLTVNYTGWLYNAAQPDQKGAEFDSSRTEGRTPLSFTLGAGEVIPGWDQGLVGMKVGGLRRIVVPPSLAYGAVRNGPIPPNATLVFEVELIDIPAETTGTQHSVSIRTDTGNYLSVENNGNSVVLANRTSIGDWETFRLVDVNGGALETGDVVRIETTTGWGFARTATGTLSATATPEQNFVEEQFVIEAIGGSITNGSQIALRSATPLFYASAEGGGGGAVNVTRSSIGSWETFTLVIH
jgi:FKBP-type peptidyl-prolyl cis-trans isomerase FkpA